MPADRVPALAAFPGPIEQYVGNLLAALAPNTEAGKRRVPGDGIGFQRPHLTQSEPLPVRHCPFPRLLAAS